jgi:hypothetical protein
LIAHLALVTETPLIRQSELAEVSAAIQKQITRDFGPIWGVQATIDAFENLDDIPVGYWPVVVVEEVPGSGTHLDRGGQPYALVEAGPTWSLAASHEVLETLTDPFAGRLVAGPSPDPNQGRVEFLIEVCDPCQDVTQAYACNDVLVSDFCTPQYFEPVSAAAVRYSFSGAVRAPREVLRGGCLSWRLPATRDWFQLDWFHDRPEIKNLGRLRAGGTLRGEIYAAAPRAQNLSKLDERHEKVEAARMRRRAGSEVRRSTARELRALIEEQRSLSKPPST